MILLASDLYVFTPERLPPAITSAWCLCESGNREPWVMLGLPEMPPRQRCFYGQQARIAHARTLHEQLLAHLKSEPPSPVCVLLETSLLCEDWLTVLLEGDPAMFGKGLHVLLVAPLSCEGRVQVERHQRMESLLAHGNTPYTVLAPPDGSPSDDLLSYCARWRDAVYDTLSEIAC